MSQSEKQDDLIAQLNQAHLLPNPPQFLLNQRPFVGSNDFKGSPTVSKMLNSRAKAQRSPPR